MADSDGLLEVFTALRARLTRLILRIVPPDEVEDIVQETYVRVCQIEQKDIRQPRSFLFRTAQNLALDYAKRAETRLTSSCDAIDDIGSPNEYGREDWTFIQVSSEEEFARFCEAVRRLPQQCRRAFVLMKVYGHSQREIARKMNISENTVENYIALGVKRCQVYLNAVNREHSPSRRVSSERRKPVDGQVEGIHE